MDFQRRHGTKIEDEKKYLYALARAAGAGKLIFPGGYLPPWERAEKARQEAAREEKEKEEKEKIAKEIRENPLTAEQRRKMVLENAPGLIQ